MEKNLSELKPGQFATILGFRDEEVSIKLLEMGCLPGEIVRLEHIAPLGDPISILVAGYSLSLRKAEAETIYISINN